MQTTICIEVAAVEKMLEVLPEHNTTLYNRFGTRLQSPGLWQSGYNKQDQLVEHTEEHPNGEMREVKVMSVHLKKDYQQL